MFSSVAVKSGSSKRDPSFRHSFFNSSNVFPRYFLGSLLLILGRTGIFLMELKRLLKR